MAAHLPYRPTQLSSTNARGRLTQRSSGLAALAAERSPLGADSQPPKEEPLEQHFDRWDLPAVQELERLSRTLPVLPRDGASAFFKAAKKATRADVDPVERFTGKVFDSLMGVVSASDRKDFTATWELTTPSIAQGVLMVETYDSVIGSLFCVARVSENSFLTRGFTQSAKEAVKGLRCTPASDASSPEDKKWWHFWS